MRVQRVLIIAAALTVLVPAGASAAAAGEEQGVTATKGAHGYVLHFAPKAAAVYRKIAGRRVEVGCGPAPDSTLFGVSVLNGSSTVVRAARHRGPLPTGIGDPADYCTVRTTGSTRELVALVPLDARGRTYLDNAATATLLFVPFFAADSSSTTPPPTDRVVARGRGLIVAMDGPDASPPRRKVGYWTDGHRVVVAALTAAGRRLFYEVDGDVVRSNAFAYLDLSS